MKQDEIPCLAEVGLSGEIGDDQVPRHRPELRTNRGRGVGMSVGLQAKPVGSFLPVRRIAYDDVRLITGKPLQENRADQPPMSRIHIITTGARLHFGLMSYRPPRGREFGGAGLMIDSPSSVVAVSAHAADLVTAPSAEIGSRAEQFLSAYRSRCPAKFQPPPCHVAVRTAIPAHSGLGSGTQLALAVAQGLALLGGDASADPVTLAHRVGRGLRSALGIHGFGNGGFLLDGGKTTEECIGALEARAEFPASWRLVLITPPGETGLSDSAERDAFAGLPPMPIETTRELRRLGLAVLLPAVIAADFEAAGAALFEFGRVAGDYFSFAQGGTYANATLGRLVDHLREQGHRGVAQSSWGPTLAVLCRDVHSANTLVGDLAVSESWSCCQTRVATALNTGARIESVEADRA